MRHIAAANNFLTVGVLSALRERARRVPEEVAVVGFDDIPQMAFLDPFVTVAAQPSAQMGQRAATRLIERIEALRTGSTAVLAPPGREEIFETQLVLRRSCGCPDPLTGGAPIRPSAAPQGVASLV